MTNKEADDVASQLEKLFHTNDENLARMSSDLAEVQSEFKRTHPENATPAQYGVLLQALSIAIKVIESSRVSQAQAHRTVCTLLRDLLSRD